MEARAVARHVRISPRKARIVAELVKGETVERALEILKYTPKAAAVPVMKTVQSAMHNLVGMSDHPLDPGDMGIKEVVVDEGRTMYRIRPRAQGRAYRIRKRSSHITVVIEHEGPVVQKKTGKKAKEETKEKAKEKAKTKAKAKKKK
jgi:large subunit ribosomal protein L22